MMARSNIKLSNSFGQNVQLGSDYRSARRLKSYNKGIVLSADPLTSTKVFQFEVQMSREKDWGGTFKFGVTSLPPSRACAVNTATDLHELSFILAVEEGLTYLFVSGKKVLPLPDYDLGSLKTAGVMYKPEKALHFFLDDAHLRFKLPPSIKLPSTLYGIIDIYGQCSDVKILPTGHMTVFPPAKTYEVDEKSVQFFVDELARKEKLSEMELTSQQVFPANSSPLTSEYGFSVPPIGGQQVQYSQMIPQLPPPLTVSTGQALSQSVQSMSSHVERHVVAKPCLCEYRDRCLRFLKEFVTQDYYFDHHYDKCYCLTCAGGRIEPTLRESGVFGNSRRYAVPLNWVKFGLKLNRASKIEANDFFRTCHKAYHGTNGSRLDSILDCGELLPPGTHTSNSQKVERPKGHFNEFWKPDHHDPDQIFLSPSIEYATYKEVYAKSTNFTHLSKTYRGKVCLKVLIEPDSYKMSEQTVRTDGQQVDKLFSNSELEWSTKEFTRVHLYGLMVKLVDVPE